MLQAISGKLASRRIVLASSSPRRAQILNNVNFPFEIVHSDYDESKIDKCSFKETQDYVIETARCKALAVAERLKSDERMPDLIIGADTAVTVDGRIYGKPEDREDAFNMLSRLSDKKHTIYTGVVLVTYPLLECPKVAKSFYEATDVVMDKLTSEIIYAYIDTKEPMDKAGGYGCQALGGTFVKAIHGDYFNVLGFPLHHFCKQLLELYSEEKS